MLLHYSGLRSEDSYLVQLDQRRWERRIRNQYGYFIPYHCKEAQVLRRECFSVKYLRVPSWWGPYEVPYWLSAETPWCVTYKSLDLVAQYGEADPFWDLFLTEHLQNVLIAAVYAARDGRLCRLSAEILRGIRHVGVRQLLPNEQESTWVEASALLVFIERIRWASVPMENRILPDVASPFLPVFTQSGDWVRFDPTSWSVVNPPGGLLPVEEDGTVVPEAPGPLFGGGDVRHLPQQGMPSGRAGQVGAAIASGRYPGRAIRGYLSRTDIRRSDRVVAQTCEALRLREALVANGVRGRPTTYEVVKLLRDILGTGKEVVVVPPSGTNAGDMEDDGAGPSEGGR